MEDLTTAAVNLEVHESLNPNLNLVNLNPCLNENLLVHPNINPGARERGRA
jgi:hypothetical protein